MKRNREYTELIKKHPLIEQALRLGTPEGNRIAVQIAYSSGYSAGYIEGTEKEWRKTDQSFQELQEKSREITERINDGKR